MIIAEVHRKKDPKIITAFNALREDANWIFKLVEKYPSDLFVFDYTEVSHICVKDSIAEILRDVEVQNIMDEYMEKTKKENLRQKRKRKLHFEK
jgi:hypothetical protein